MTRKVLFVDDEPRILDGLRRQLARRFEMETATSGAEALGTLEANGPFAVIVSDMRMPEMDGVELLAEVRGRSPDSVRMILSGQADLQSAIDAVNQGEIFRFFTKPCDTEILVRGLEAAIDQYRLVVAERELLEKTLSGAVGVLTELLSLVDADSFSRTTRIRRYAEAVTDHLGLSDPWQIRVAAMLSQIGCVTLPPAVQASLYAGDEIEDEAARMIAEHPRVAGRIVASIPRLEPVSAMIAGQLEPVDLATLPGDPREWDPVVLGSQVLRAAVELDRALCRGRSREEALRELRAPRRAFAPALLEALESIQVREQMTTRSLGVAELRPAMVFDQDVLTLGGTVLVRRGEEITPPMLERLHNFARGSGIAEPIRVRVPA